MMLGESFAGLDAHQAPSAARGCCPRGDSQLPPPCPIPIIKEEDGAVEEPEAAKKPCSQKKDEVKMLYVFDLDDTLVNSPEPAESMRRWESAHGEKLAKQAKGGRCRGWYERSESLDSCIGITRGPVFDLWEVCASKSDALCIILTARIETLRPQVEKLAAEMLPVRFPDLVLMKPLDTPLKTPSWKASEIERLARKYPAAKRILFWDDRKENLRAVASTSSEISRGGGGVDIRVFDAHDQVHGWKKT